MTPLYSAAVNGNAAMIEQLLKAGADANTALPEGETALMTAARTGKVDAVKVLLAHGADVNAKERWKQQTALMWAAHEGNAATVEAAPRGGREHRRPVDLRLDAAVVRGAPGPERHDQGAHRRRGERQRHAAGQTSALVTAVQGLNYEAANVLLENGVDPNAAGQGWTALHQVVWSRRPQRGQNNPGQKPKGDVSSLDLAKKLVEHGADVNARADQGTQLGHGRPQQPEPVRRHAVLPGREVRATCR